MSDILTKVTDGLLTVTLNRPDKMNSIGQEMANRLTQLFLQSANDPDVRCLLITGAGKSFCAGRDLSEARPGENAFEIITTVFNPLLAAVYEFPKPSIAAVNGAAMGVGLGLALACDLVLAADNARLSSPFANLGVALDSGGHFHLPRAVGLHRALEMIYTADVVRGKQAEAWGLVNRSVPGLKLGPWSEQLGLRIAAGPTNAFMEQKQLARRALTMSFAHVLDEEARLQDRLVKKPEYEEGLKAFMQKRRPDFRSLSNKSSKAT